MLKSTYTAAAPLPAGWTEHKAPVGHTYYYNVDTKQSTYKKPAIEDEDIPLQIDYSATQPNIHASALVDSQGYSTVPSQPSNQNGVPNGRFTGGQTYFDRSRRREDNDRPRSKAQIPKCDPWLLVKTRRGRRFVHNSETKESFWKFPQDVMMAVIEMDRLEWEAKQAVESQETSTTVEKAATSQRNGQLAAATVESAPIAGEESDSYEEVEVTDSEGEDDGDPSTKRAKPNPQAKDEVAQAGPVEFTEEDMAFQLAQMGEDYDLDPSDYDAYEDDDEDGLAQNEEAQDGLTLTESESVDLFKSLLSTIQPAISPYWTFDRVLEATLITSDNRYLALPTTQRRREVFSEWAKEQIHTANNTAVNSHHNPSSFSDINDNADSNPTITINRPDPKISYLQFLSHQPPAQLRKLFWAEFKRKFRKEAIMTSLEPGDKQRELLYRDFVTKMKTGERERRKELGSLVKDVIRRKEDVVGGEAEYGQLRKLQDKSGDDDDDTTELRLTTLLPDEITHDVRYWVVSDVKDRWGIVDAHLANLKN